MANNRLYLIIPGDDEVEYAVLLAKGFGSGWDVRNEDCLPKLIQHAMDQAPVRSSGEGYGGKTAIYIEDENHPSPNARPRIYISKTDLKEVP